MKFAKVLSAMVNIVFQVQLSVWKNWERSKCVAKEYGTEACPCR